MQDTPPAWLQNPQGVEFSRRNTPDLYANRLAVKQENIRDLELILDDDKTINPKLKKSLKIVLTGEKGQDGIFAALEPVQVSSVMARSAVEVIKSQMKCRKWDAYHPTVTGIEAQRRSHIEEYLSRARRFDKHNERLIQAEMQTTQVQRQELTTHNVEEKKGFLDFLRRRTQ
jgi:hypothetical protein